MERRALLYSRCSGLCEVRSRDCIAAGGMLESGRMSVQHRRAQGAGGTDLDTAHNLANLLFVCGDGTTGCHGWIETQRRAEAEALGMWIRHATDEGRPVPAELFPVRIGGGAWRALHPFAAVYVDLPVQLRYLPVMPGPELVAPHVYPL